MKYKSFNESEIVLKNESTDISVKWSNVTDFSTSALIKYSLLKNIAILSFLLGLILAIVVYDPNSMAGSYILLVMFFLCPMAISITIWYTTLKPYKDNFINNIHSITLILKGNIHQKFDVGNIDETKKVFEDMKSAFQLNKLKAE